jgi:AcrR family transcriptional regulator
VRSDPPGGNPEQPDELARLPHGRHGLPPEFVAHNQRERLIASLAHTVTEVGYNDTTITRIIEGASVSSRTFYKYFQTVEECYLGALDSIAARLTPLVTQAYEDQGSWQLSIRASIEAIVAGPAVARRYEEGVAALVPYLRRGRELREDGDLFPETTERGLLGSMNSLVARKVAAGEAEKVPDLLPDLAQFALTPYLGPDEARRIATGGTG